ncbi:MAG: helix-turn-helix domain-containing protein [Ilumatobacter sp.]|nr:helix-turn-helix domain-containing protein [Ilumatobacter sp.]
MSTERRITLTGATGELRSRLGPTGWVVFEELLLASTGNRDGCVASVSIRTLAGRLGMAKDTVARALVRLRRAGLVTAHQSRTDSGVFATGSYTLHVPACITVSDHRTAASTTPRPRHADQLALTLTS